MNTYEKEYNQSMNTELYVSTDQNEHERCDTYRGSLKGVASGDTNNIKELSKIKQKINHVGSKVIKACIRNVENKIK